MLGKFDRLIISTDSSKQGLFQGPVLTAYTSEESHYSIERGCIMAGLGSDNVRKVPSMLPFAETAYLPYHTG